MFFEVTSWKVPWELRDMKLECRKLFRTKMSRRFTTAKVFFPCFLDCGSTTMSRRVTVAFLPKLTNFPAEFGQQRTAQGRIVHGKNDHICHIAVEWKEI
jgi:hypothetical protein